MPDPATLSLLQKIAENTGRSDSLWAAAIAGGSAILGASVAAISAYFAAKRAAEAQVRTMQGQLELENKKIRTSIVTTERLRWLQDIRKMVAEFYSNIEIQILHIARGVDNRSAISVSEMDAISRDVGGKGNLILLVLNPLNPDQSDLFNSINDTLKYMNVSFAAAQENQPPDRIELGALKKRAFDALHNVGRTAWKKVQDLE